ncbi:hypothetical protein BZG36_01441 [Bifiguratus adelaidae]|uniref:DUF654-domain-containing protein n=1 Tax=Bifiguratus adelaidae TaxID=1938954 RepID=A0A261Y5C9_9FUNG|nr:hypothetical protein BZG36_01441 [Bifiguratus adelaidae]
MSSRALRKLRKDADLAITGTSDSETSADEAPAPSGKQNLFDLLGDTGNADDESENDDEQGQNDERLPVPAEPAPRQNRNKKKKKSKKKGFAVVESNSPSSTGTASPAPSKSGQAKRDHVSDMSLEEFEKALTKAVKSSTGSASNSVAAKGKVEEERALKEQQLLAVDIRYLDAEAEMKRMFGSRVVNSEQRAKRQTRLKRHLLATPRVDWPTKAPSGIGMEPVEMEGFSDLSFFEFIHSKDYQGVQRAFKNCVATMDPNTLVILLQNHPYHVDTLLQLSEVAKHSGDWQAAGEFMERALYALEKGFHPKFNLTSGRVRLDYRRMENRAFFLAVHRQVQFLARRGCWRTAFEFNRMLLSVDPVNDPLGALLSIDFYAAKANQFEYIIQLGSLTKIKSEDEAAEPLLLSQPNFAYTVPYATFKTARGKTGIEEASKLLQQSVSSFPVVAALLLDKCGESFPGTNHPIFVLARSDAKSEAKALVELYAERSFALWKEPEVLEWLKENIQAVLQKAKTNCDTSAASQSATWQSSLHRELSLNYCRHIVCSEFPTLLSYLPSTIITRSLDMYDPLPPSDSYDSYESVSGVRQGASNLVAAIFGLDDPNGRRRPGGATNAQLVQAFEQAMLVARGAPGQVPGAFPGLGEEMPPVVGEGEDGEAEEIPRDRSGMINFLRDSISQLLARGREGGVEEDREEIDDAIVAEMIALQDQQSEDEHGPIE